MLLVDAISFLILYIQLEGVYTILGGHDVNISQVPYHVNYGDICGGVLIHKKWTITTAHCGTHGFIRIGSRYRVRGPKVLVVAHLVHPQYGMKHEYDYDIQLLKLKRNLLFGKTVSAIDMCDGECGNDILVAGWGYPVERNDHKTGFPYEQRNKCLYERIFVEGDYKEILQLVQIRVVSFSRCQAVTEFWYNHTLTSRMFCAGDVNRDACQGDSGGGAVSRDGLTGLSSFGIGCGRVPGVYVNTSHLGIRSWIRKHTAV